MFVHSLIYLENTYKGYFIPNIILGMKNPPMNKADKKSCLYESYIAIDSLLYPQELENDKANFHKWSSFLVNKIIYDHIEFSWIL